MHNVVVRSAVATTGAAVFMLTPAAASAAPRLDVPTNNASARNIVIPPGGTGGIAIFVDPHSDASTETIRAIDPLEAVFAQWADELAEWADSTWEAGAETWPSE